ncbi:UDP-N-acetylglucosamine 1-carboxyvinyltransferase [Thermoleophilum album]|uniref:UDP-N-acetylglucosamine 1-carboxyvinyltransferase n=1 Tax=Thermoleophilum album TaxID=29539 RepID=A0A1H6FYM1_THEAL|nr:UDP-N-acetylglucosamine 1-carboxyvinyltransferase [Thermoleophilum album]SEH14815.1 UDP-N-acetylglucosamine 1-carboxyvinyltransferase [Thermoleophilum album]
MEKFVIEGGVPLSGTVRPAGNKNAALPALAAALLTEEPVTLRNVPRIRDVDAMVRLLEQLGASVEWIGANEVTVHAREIRETRVDPELAREIRASFLLAGPLLARYGRAVMPPPGGDVIGRRRLDPHLDAFRALGARVASGRFYELAAEGGLRPCDFFMDEPSVMATENALMAAALTPGTTVIHNAAAEPHVQDLARLLIQMGARVEGIGSNRLIVEGCRELGGADYTIGPDHIEIGSFIALAACTGGELRIKDTVPEDLRMVRIAFERLGCRIEFDGRDVVVPPNQRLRVKDDDGNAIAKIEDGPWPAFPADLTSIALAMATQADGLILIHEKMFENRLFFVDKLVSMGARVIVCDPHRAVVSGPSKLHGERLESPDIRAGMALLIAALCADGTSEIGNIRQIDRGYERIDERLRSLGARIERVGRPEEPLTTGARRGADLTSL